MQQIWLTALGVYIGVLLAAAHIWALNKGMKIFSGDDAPWPVLAGGAIPPLLLAATFAILKYS